ncbi:MAG TPA: hypothetical protein VKQ32_11495, partial [Polyangia bacterium]|nr:hypothetical protein [Polyangia bacterium]
MSRTRAILPFVVLLIALDAACSSKESGGSCVAGASVACACTDGRAGAQICRDGGLGECVCSGS